MENKGAKEGMPLGEKEVWPIAKQYGIIGGFILIIYFLIANLLQINYPINPFGFIFYSIISLFIRVGILIYPLRLDAAKYEVKFKRAFLLSFVVAIFAFMMESGFDTFFVTIVDPEFLTHYTKSFEELYRNTELDEAKIEANVKVIKEVAANRKLFIENIFGVTIQSAFMALMVSLAFVRGNRNKQN